MIVIFGWLKERQIQYGLSTSYCFICSKPKIWLLVYETEWFTFLGMRTVPYLRRRFVVCEECGDTVPVSAREMKAHFSPLDTALGQVFIERHQLSKKTETQRHFLRVMRDGAGGSKYSSLE